MCDGHDAQRQDRRRGRNIETKPERDPGDQAQALWRSMHRESQGAKRTVWNILFEVQEPSDWQPGSESEPGSDLEV